MAEYPTKTLGDLRISWDGQGGLVFPADETRTSNFSLACDGIVLVEGERFKAQANRLHYDAEKNLLLLESNEKVMAEVNWTAGDDAVVSRIAARRIALWLSEGRFAVEDADCVFLKSKGKKGKPTSPPKAEPSGQESSTCS